MLCEMVVKGETEKAPCTQKALRRVRVGREGPFQREFDLCWGHMKETMNTCTARVVGDA